MLWKLRSAAPPPKSTLGGGSEEELNNKEWWKCVGVLRGHTLDIQDLAWSPDDTKIASCSLDAKVCVWNVAELSVIHEIDHGCWVKGIDWDPMDQFIATLSTDHKIRLWRTVDYSLAHTIEGFIGLKNLKAPEVVHNRIVYSRISWSPDGGALVSSHGFDEPSKQFSSPVFRRGTWKHEVHYMGHEKPTTVAVCICIVSSFFLLFFLFRASFPHTFHSPLLHP